MTKKYFGTDGIRGKVGEGVITADFTLRLGFAIGKYLKQENPKRRCSVVIGKDTRVSGYLFESALEAGLTSAGCNVFMLGPMPTPAVAYLTRTFSCDLGIVISASHNPYFDNGIKLFTNKGNKLSDEAELSIEALIDQPMNMVGSDEIGRVKRIDDAAGRYIEFCKSTVPRRISFRGMRIVVDCANGATYHIAPSVFRELGAQVITISDSPNGLNINDNCGSTAPKQLQQAVLEHQADLGVAFDGDGDRVICVASTGDVVDGDDLAYIIASEQQSRGQCPGVVGTLMTNLGVEQALKAKGIDFARAQVGDRYVKELMLEKGWYLGAEASGHIICADSTTTGDGIIAALRVLVACIDLDTTLDQWCIQLEKFPQRTINVPIRDKSALEHRDVQAFVDETQRQLGDTGRVLLRPSGTEPVVRVTVEAQSATQVDTLVTQLASKIEPIVS